MRKWLILLSALCGTTASSAPAWTWVDANGTVHYEIEYRGADGKEHDVELSAEDEVLESH